MSLFGRILSWLFSHPKEIARTVREVSDAVRDEPESTPWPYETVKHVEDQIHEATSHRMTPHPSKARNGNGEQESE